VILEKEWYRGKINSVGKGDVEKRWCQEEWCLERVVLGRVVSKKDCQIGSCVEEGIVGSWRGDCWHIITSNVLIKLKQVKSLILILYFILALANYEFKISINP